MNKDNKERSGKPFVTQVEGKGIDTVVDPTFNPPVNPLAQPQPINALSDAQKATQDELASSAKPNAVTNDGRPIDTETVNVEGRPVQTGPKVPVPGAETEVRVEVPPGMEHLADGKEQIAYATITVPDKTVARGALAAEPLGSKRLTAEQEAGKASLERKHGPHQLEKEQTTGKKAANKA